jgi:hypothetical protein
LRWSKVFLWFGAGVDPSEQIFQGKPLPQRVYILNGTQYKMRIKLFLILSIATLELLICSSVAVAQEKGEIYQIDITYDTLGLYISPCPLPGISGDTWRITNLASDTIYLLIPLCVGKKNPHAYTLEPGDSVDHLIGVWDAELWVFLPNNGEIAKCDRVHMPSCPALTQWGIIILIVLMMGSAISIGLRKKKAAVPA